MTGSANLESYGWDDDWAITLSQHGTDGRPARVLRHDGVAATVVSDTGIAQVPLLPGCESLVVGDWVAIQASSSGNEKDGTIMVEARLPRRNLLRRRDSMADREHSLAANLDLVLIICGADRPIRAGRIQRMLALAADAGVEANVVLTKVDLFGGPDERATAHRRAESAAPGTDVFEVSSLEGIGLGAVRSVCRGRTTALLGESGAGKSTLVNTIVGADLALTGSVRTSDSRGKHTTTAREVHLIPGGGLLVDTPGLRAVGVWVEPGAIEAAFPDIGELAGGCRFTDCSHGPEPGCAVRAAVEDGALDVRRLESFLDLRAEAIEAEMRKTESGRRRSGRRHRR